MKKYLMYISITKKFIIRAGEKVHRNKLGELTTAQMAEAQDNPDIWIFIGDNNGKDRR
jgi:hypothetical protein